MTTFAEPTTVSYEKSVVRKQNKGRLFVKWATSTDHKTIGYMYLITSFSWFLIGGIMALMIRGELSAPGLQFFSMEQYNQLFTMHGTIMLLMFATPLFVGFANVIMPLQIGAADVAFPRLNMFSYWMYLFGGLMAFAGFLAPGGAASFGWTVYAPLSSSTYSPGLGLESDRLFGSHIFDPANGGAMLFQHLFWFFGHPEVYILALPFFGVATEILPVFSRKPVFGYKGLIAATIAISALSVSVWAHHMFATGQVLLPFFSFMTFLIGVPTGVKFFNWIGTMWRGSLTFETPMLFTVGFLITFLFGGLTGIILASPPMDFAVSASYFVVAHFHYVLFGTVVFAMFAGFYFWWPKFTGKMLNETLGKIHFWTLFVGFHTTFLIQHWLGIKGFPRRYADYSALDGFTFMNEISTIGSVLLGLSMIPFFINVWITRNSPKVTVDDPWGYGASLEWATSCPPPRHNFTSIPRIRSERPAFDLHHPGVDIEKLH